MASQAATEFIREEDFVEYFLYPELTIQESLESLLQDINAFVDEFSRPYIWHKDRFHLKIRDQNDELFESVVKNAENGSMEAPFLYGVSHFGENIQDEWFIVAILLELTKKFKGLVGRVVDSDGEFLLIEAANHLPKWVNPETCEGKVFLFNGLVHIVHDENNPEHHDDIKTIDLIQQLHISPDQYCISNTAFESIQDRIKAFPEKIRDQQHLATIFIPISIASILKHRPDLISHAVLAFCNRDPIDNKVLRAMRYFPPEERVYTNVLFTKCLYAMLVHNQFIPDRRTGWNMPSTKSAEHKAHLLGIKVACGFEILANQGKINADEVEEKDRDWHRFIGSLTGKNYFRGLLEGSKEYTDLLDKAKSYYRENCAVEKTGNRIGKEIVGLLKGSEVDKPELIRSQKSLATEDSEEWLQISSEELDDMLKKRYGQTSVITTTSDSKALSSILSDFLDKKSEFDGVEVEEPPKSKGKSKKSKLKTGNIDFNPDEFQSAMQNLLEIVIPEDKWESNSEDEMSSYGHEDDLERNLEDMTNNFGQNRSEFDDYLDEMDRELSRTKIGSSFERASKVNLDDFDDIEDFKPVDIDTNTVKNMLESYRAQMGTSGPASNMLGALGVRFNTEQTNGTNAYSDDELGDLKNTAV